MTETVVRRRYVEPVAPRADWPHWDDEADCYVMAAPSGEVYGNTINECLGRYYEQMAVAATHQRRSL